MSVVPKRCAELNSLALILLHHSLGVSCDGRRPPLQGTNVAALCDHARIPFTAVAGSTPVGFLVEGLEAEGEAVVVHAETVEDGGYRGEVIIKDGSVVTAVDFGIGSLMEGAPPVHEF